MCLYKNFLFVVFLFFNSIVFSQNESYHIIYDSIYSIWEKDYERTKTLWLETIKKHNIDPSETALFLGLSLEKKDIKFYKKRIGFLIKNYGWNYTYLDTNEERMSRNSLLRKIYDNNLVEWTYKKSQKYFYKWEKKHPNSRRYKSLITSMLKVDQIITRFVPTESDTFCKKYFETINEQISNVDFEHIIEISEICKLNNRMMLNNFDDGVGIYYQIQFIIWHNLKTKSNFQKTWDLLLPFIDEAYFKGKIGYSIYYAYDKWSYSHFGNQYYGTLGNDILIRDNENYERRKIKYKL